MNGEELTQGQARHLLAQYAEWHSRRDEIITAALTAGISEHEIWQTTGHARDTIRKIRARQESPDE